jgi:hypothetical protein
MKAMSGQGNCITIPVPYIDFFAGDRQSHLLAAILNQMVFWSGKSHLQDGWFYKGHEELAVEVRAVSEDSIRRAMDRIIKEYLPGAIEEKLRKVSGIPRKHYRINEEIFIHKVFPHLSDSALTPNGNGVNAESAEPLDSAQATNGNSVSAESAEAAETVDSAQAPNGNGVNAEWIPRKRRMETALTPNPGIGVSAESILYTDLKNRLLLTDHKNRPGEKSPVDNFLLKYPDAVIFDAEKSLWGSADDLAFAEWFFASVVELHERAAEFDGMVSRPKEPNWTVWANEIRLLREGQGCTHEHMRTMVERIQGDQWWCNKVQRADTLRDKWPELALKLCPASLVGSGANFGSSGQVDKKTPSGFRGAP